MSVDLAPRRRGVSSYHSGSFSWSWMASRGVFLCACGKIEVRRDRASILDNGGFRVTADEARSMARAAWGLYVVETWKLEEWARLSPTERARREALPLLRRDPNDWLPVREDFVDRALEFAWFAHASGGFRVY